MSINLLSHGTDVAMRNDQCGVWVTTSIGGGCGHSSHRVRGLEADGTRRAKFTAPSIVVALTDPSRPSLLHPVARKLRALEPSQVAALPPSGSLPEQAAVYARPSSHSCTVVQLHKCLDFEAPV